MRYPDKATAAGAWVLENGHRFLLGITGGRWPKKVLGMQPLELHTTGRRSGQRRTTLITSPIYAPEQLVLVASKGGHSDHPDWYKNLAANPTVEITVDGTTTAMVARTAGQEEKAELWPEIVAVYKGYEGYRRNTDRDIPVVVVELPDTDLTGTVDPGTNPKT